MHPLIRLPQPVDVTPYAEALTRFLLRHRLSSSLPRKFKIAFEGCSRNHIKLTINDIGWLARVENGRRGFRVYIGGGTATMTTAAAVLFDFLPVEDTLIVAEAIIRVFHERGDYQHKQRNRMKFLIKAMGWDAFKTAFEAALTQVRPRREALRFDEEPPAAEAAPMWREDRPRQSRQSSPGAGGRLAWSRHRARTTVVRSTGLQNIFILRRRDARQAPLARCGPLLQRHVQVDRVAPVRSRRTA